MKAKELQKSNTNKKRKTQRKRVIFFLLRKQPQNACKGLINDKWQKGGNYLYGGTAGGGNYVLQNETPAYIPILTFKFHWANRWQPA
jgi:hypothetical protein